MHPGCRYKFKIQLRLLTNKTGYSAVKMLPAPEVKIYVTKHLRIQPDFTLAVNLPSTDKTYI